MPDDPHRLVLPLDHPDAGGRAGLDVVASGPVGSDGMNEPMDPFVAVFNLHVNQAGKKANQDVIKRYGRLKFQQVFPSLYRKGIMVMFKTPPIRMTQFWVDRVTYYVNQKEAPCDTSTPSI